MAKDEGAWRRNQAQKTLYNPAADRAYAESRKGRKTLADYLHLKEIGPILLLVALIAVPLLAYHYL